MRKKFKLFSLIILLTVLILPFTVKAADEGGYYGGIIEITLPTVPEVGQQPIIVDPNEHINILSHQWINDTEHRVMTMNETFKADQKYTYMVYYENNPVYDIEWFESMWASDYYLGPGVFNVDLGSVDDARVAVASFYMGDIDDRPEPDDNDYYQLNIDEPQLGDHPVYLTESNVYSFNPDEEIWYNLTDDRVMTENDVFEENKRYKYQVRINSYYYRPESIEAFDNTDYYIDFEYEEQTPPYSDIINAYFYFGNKSDLVVSTGDVVINSTNPPAAGGTLTLPNITTHGKVEVRAEWDMLVDGDFVELTEGTEVEVGKYYRYYLYLEPAFGYVFADDFGIVDENVNQNRITFYGDGGSESYMYESMFIILAEGATMGIYGDHLVYPTYSMQLLAFPYNEANNNSTWTSSNPSVATVSQDGVVTGVASGTATITATNTLGVSVTHDVVVGVPVGSITLEEDEITMYVGSTYKVNATISPSNATLQDVQLIIDQYQDGDDETYNMDSVWSIDDTIYAESEGTVRVIVQSKDPAEVSTVLTVHVIPRPPIEEMEFEESSVTVPEGQYATLHLNIEPEEGDLSSVTWASSDESIAYIDMYGVVRAVAPGTVTITATAPGNIEATCEVTVTPVINPESISLNKEHLTLVDGTSEMLILSFEPEGATLPPAVWSSSDPSVALVDETGTVTAVGEGTTTITVITTNDLIATCEVTVVSASYKPVTGIDLSVTSRTIEVDDTFKINATIIPSDATDKTITWTTGNPYIAVVDDEGWVTGVGPGVTSIVAHTSSGDIRGICDVTVLGEEIEVLQVSLDEDAISLEEEEVYTLTATITPENATNRMLTWTSSNPNVATINNNGQVTAISEGTAVITVTTANGLTDDCTVTVTTPEIPVTGIELSVTNRTIGVGDNFKINATIIPSNAQNKLIMWSSDDDNIAVVDDEGYVTGVNPGTTRIIAQTSVSGVRGVCTVTVSDDTVEVLGVSLDKEAISLEEYEIYTLTATITPENATDKTLIWTSSDSDVADVDSNGQVTALNEGTAVITVTTANGLTDDCTVTVLPYSETPVTSISLNKTTLVLTEGTNETLVLSFEPEGATLPPAEWTSSNRNVARVDETGKVRAIGVGNATITVRTLSGLIATCEVTVVSSSVTPVTSISLNKTTLSLAEGTSEMLVLSFQPSTGTLPPAIWTSSNPEVATTDETGIVRAISPGTATITVTTTNDLTATCEVTVTSATIAVTGIDLSVTNRVMEPGDSFKINATITPSNATDKTITWSSSDTNVATVDAEGTVTAVSTGTATIYAQTSASGIRGTCTITVVDEIIPETGITLNKETLSLEKDEIYTLSAEFTPSNATDKTLTWTSSNTSVATVNNNGQVTAVGVGNATITATTVNGFTATCEVTVTQPEVTSISLNKTSLVLKEGTNETLVLSFEPEGAVLPPAEWTSSNRNVARVDENGKVRAVGVGNATITVTVNGLTATCQVTVSSDSTPVATSISLNKPTLSLEEGTNETLVLSFKPDGAVLPPAEWTSSDPSVATVDETGTVRAIKAGTTRITVTTTNNLTATCEVTVTKPATPEVTSISLNKESLNLTAGEDETLVLSFEPDGAVLPPAVWTSSDPTIATVDETGTVRALRAGTTTITVNAINNLTATCEVSVTASDVPVTSISLNKTTVSIPEGVNEMLVLSFEPIGGALSPAEWTSSDPTVATVDETGTVRALKTGTTTITVTTVDGLTAECEVTVTKATIDVTGITLNKNDITLYEGDKETLVATVTPSNADDKSVTWTSSNRNVVRVDLGGRRTIRKETATITATTSNGIEATCTVKVVEKSKEMSFTDVPKTAWYYEPIRKAYEKNIIAGYSPYIFGPNDKITRGQMVTFLWRIEGQPTVSEATTFKDVKNGQYYTEAVKWAAKNGIVHGYSKDKFGPANNIIRQDLVVILNNYAKFKEKEYNANYDLSGFADFNRVHGYALPALKWAVKNGVMNGQDKQGKKYISPQNNTTRAEAATMIVNFLQKFGLY